MIEINGKRSRVFRYEDCVGVITNGLTHSFFDTSGRIFTIRPTVWRRGDEVVANFMSRLSAEQIAHRKPSSAEIQADKEALDGMKQWRGGRGVLSLIIGIVFAVGAVARVAFAIRNPDPAIFIAIAIVATTAALAFYGVRSKNSKFAHFARNLDQWIGVLPWAFFGTCLLVLADLFAYAAIDGLHGINRIWVAPIAIHMLVAPAVIAIVMKRRKSDGESASKVMTFFRTLTAATAFQIGVGTVLLFAYTFLHAS